MESNKMDPLSKKIGGIVGGWFYQTGHIKLLKESEKKDKRKKENIHKKGKENKREIRNKKTKY